MGDGVLNTNFDYYYYYERIEGPAAPANRPVDISHLRDAATVGRPKRQPAGQFFFGEHHLALGIFLKAPSYFPPGFRPGWALLVAYSACCPGPGSSALARVIWRVCGASLIHLHTYTLTRAVRQPRPRRFFFNRIFVVVARLALPFGLVRPRNRLRARRHTSARALGARTAHRRRPYPPTHANADGGLGSAVCAREGRFGRGGGRVARAVVRLTQRRDGRERSKSPPSQTRACVSSFRAPCGSQRHRARVGHTSEKCGAQTRTANLDKERAHRVASQHAAYAAPRATCVAPARSALTPTGAHSGARGLAWPRTATGEGKGKRRPITPTFPRAPPARLRRREPPRPRATHAPAYASRGRRPSRSARARARTARSAEQTEGATRHDGTTRTGGGSIKHFTSVQVDKRAHMPIARGFGPREEGVAVAAAAAAAAAAATTPT